MNASIRDIVPSSASCSSCWFGRSTRLLFNGINAFVANVLRKRGLGVVAFGLFNEENKPSRTSLASISRTILTLGRVDDGEAVLVGCTSPRLVDRIAKIE